MIPAYPLQWPVGWARAPWRKAATFTRHKERLSVYDGVTRVLRELERFGIGRDDIVISTNVPTRMDGFPRSDAPNPGDPGVAVYWQTRKNERRVMAIDVYERVADNLAAVAASLEAMRALERHGGARILERAFTGFTALPEPGKSSHWRDVLGFGTLPATKADVDAVYRSMASKAHPDKGGSHERMAELNRARDEALREVSP